MVYFGDGIEHSTCSLGFTLAVGAQGHTETWPALLRAANRGDLKATRRAADPLDATAGRYGHSALHRAALHGYPLVVKHLVAVRAQVDQRDSEELTPIFMAAFSGHVEAAGALEGRLPQVLKALVPHGALSQKDGSGATPLQWAATQGHVAAVHYLLQQGLPATARNSQGGGPVSAAATMGHSEVLEELAPRS